MTERSVPVRGGDRRELPGQRSSNELLSCQLLGPLQIRRGSTVLPFTSMPQQVVFAVLALHANRPVERDQLIDAVWGTTRPAYAVNLVQKRISELRHVIEPDRPAGAPSSVLRWTERGYVLSLPDEGLDLWRHRRELDDARVRRLGGDLLGAAQALRKALSLWRGQAFEGLSSPLLDAERDRLAQARITASEERIEIELGLGTSVDPVPELRGLIGEHPLRERLRVLLMRALYRAGRQAEALGAYHEARLYFDDELGIAPGAELQLVHSQILTADPRLLETMGGKPEAASDAAHWRAAPAELPHALPHFAGRTHELERLDALVEAEDAARQLQIVAIAGTAGVGKTALAVHWAHRVRHRFPDGQLYVNLRGFDPTNSTVEPADAIRGFLDAITGTSTHLPVSLEGQAALFRSLLAGRRMLILLDNARDAEHVRPLLPGTPGCLVIVTSRNQLAGLVATDGAHPIDVGLLSSREARRLLRRRLGADRLAAEPAAVDRIVSMCARLPLALTIVAARAAAYPDFPLAALAAEMGDTRAQLDAFSGDDVASDVRAVFSWSYDRLSPPAQRLFRLLGVHPSGPDVSLAAAASVAGVPVRAVRATLGELTRANLHVERRPGRFAQHDLLRAYAGELALSELIAAERLSAVRRGLDFYLRTAVRADQLLSPHRDDPVRLELPAAGVVPVDVSDYGEADAWFIAEHFILLAAVRQALDVGLPRHAWQLSWALNNYLEFRGHWHDAVAVLHLGVDATRQLGDHRATTTALNLLGRAYTRLTRYDEAAAQLSEALAIAAANADLPGQAMTHRNVAWILDRRGRYEEAVEHAFLALEMFRAEEGQRLGEGRALNAVGWFHALLENYDRALAYCADALHLQALIGDPLGQAETLDSLGYINFRSGSYADSIRHYREAIHWYQQLGDRYNEADTRSSLGEVLAASGELELAHGEWRVARAILEQLGHADVNAVRAKLRIAE